MVRRKRIEKKQKERVIATVHMPEETFGVCANKQCHRHRAGIKEILGSKLCQRCFDKGVKGPK